MTPTGGLAVSIGAGGLNRAAAHYLPGVVAKLKSLVVPGASSKHFNYGNIAIASVGYDTFNVGFADATNQASVIVDGVHLSTVSASFKVHAKILFAKVSCSGTFDAAVSGTNLNLAAVPGVTADGHPQASIKTGIHFGSVVVHHKLKNTVCKIAQSIVQLFIGSVNKQIEDIVKKEVPSIVQKEIVAIVNPLLASIPLTLPIDKAAGVDGDFRLSAAPNIVQNTLHVVDLARFEPTLPAPPAQWPPPGGFPAPTALPLPSNTSSDVTLQLGEYAMNSVAASFAYAGLLKQPPQVIKPTQQWNTSLLLDLFPKMAGHLPPGQNLSFVFGVGEQVADWPLAILTAAGGGKATFSVKGYINLTCATPACVHGDGGAAPSGPPLAILALSVDAVASAGFYVKSSNVSAIAVAVNIGLGQFTLALDNSIVGKSIDVKLLDTLITFVLKDIIIPWANKKYGSIGIPLPAIKGVQIKDPVLSLTEVDGCLTIGASIVFTGEADAVVAAARAKQKADVVVVANVTTA